MKLRPTFLAWLLSVAFMLIAQPALASPTPQERGQARLEWQKGKQAVAQRRQADAVAAFRSALALDPKAQYRLDLARALSETGELVEAMGLLSEVLETTEPDTGMAKAAARKLSEQVDARLPRLRVTVAGPAPGKAVTTVNGQPIEATEEVPFDPGTYLVGARAEGYEPAEREVTLAEGARESVTLSLASVAELARLDEDEEPEQGSSSGTVLPAAVAFGIGGVGLVVGSVFGVMAFSETNAVQDQCTDGRCPADQADALSAAQTKGDVSTVAFIVGGAGVAAGIVLLLAFSGDDDPAEDARPRVMPVVGPGFLGAQGTF